MNPQDSSGTSPQPQPTTKEPEALLPNIEPSNARHPGDIATPLNTNFAGASEQLSKLWQDLWQEDRQSTVTVIAIAILVVPVWLLVSDLLKLINSLPFLAPAFELIGVAYTLWFTYRYLLFAKTRQELLDTVQGIREKILGQG